MNAKFLRDAVSCFGDDPVGIGHFRKVIIGLAIGGKLTGDGDPLSSRKMLAQIEEEKFRLLRDGQISRLKRYGSVTEEQLPEVFSDPSSFVPLGSIARIEKGLTGIQGAKSGSFPLVVTAAERGSCDHFDFEGAATIVPLVSSTGHGHASINRLHYQEGRFALGTILAAIFPFAPTLTSARFIFEYLSTFKEELLVSRMTGTANVTLSVGRIAEVPIPLICPSVQAKADELMALCDQLEVARAERETARDTLALSTMARLNTPDPETFAADARFTLANLAPLTTRPDQIKQLRQTILNLAVRGGLSADDAWAQAPRTLGSVASLQNGYAFKSQWFAKSGTRLLRNANVGHGDLNWADAVYLSEEMFCEFTRFALEEGDVVLSLDRPFIVTGTKVARVKSSDLPSLLLQRVGRFVTSPEIVKDYLHLWITSPHFSAQVDPGRSNGVPHISSKQVEAAFIYLPPLAEQHRIVAKVDAVMALCDQLQASITTGEQTRSRLLEAVLHNALEAA